MSINRQSRTASEIFQKGFLEPYLRAGDKPFIKLLNWYTGFGKTYTAALFAIDLFVKCDVIPVFIAPLQSIVGGFANDLKGHSERREYADHIEEAIRSHSAPILVHRLYSVDYHINDRTFFSAAVELADWLDANPKVFAQMEQSAKQADMDKGFASRLAEMRSKCLNCHASQFLSMSPSDDTYEDTKAAYLRAARRARSVADSITSRLIVLDINSRRAENSDERYMAVPQVADMVRRLHPLQAFLDNPGVIVSTASKAQVGQKVYVFDKTKGKHLWRDFENLPLFLEELNRDGSVLGRMVSRRPDSARVVTFVDEEEDSYWYLFDQRKSVVNSEGRNELNVVITEFFTYFDLKWPLAFEGRGGSDLKLAGKVYDHLEHFAKVSEAADREFEVEKINKGASYILDGRRVEILRKVLADKFPRTAERFDDDELLQILHQLHDKNDVQNKFKRFRQKARVLEQLRAYVAKIRPPQRGHYDTFRDLRDLVFDKKFFTMNRSTYGEVLDQPSQTFFNDSASVMDTEFLKQVELKRDTAHQTVRLHYHENDVPADAYTLLHYLELVLFVARVLVVRDAEDAVDFTKADIDRYPNLYRFRNDVRQLFKDPITSEGLAQETSSNELLTEAFFFNKTKSVVTLEESRRQAEEYNLSADISLTLTITTLRATPEEDLVHALGRTNGIFLMSATGGLSAASAGAFNTKQLRRVLQAKGGIFSEMSDEELNIASAQAQQMLDKRDRKVTILDDTNPSARFGVSGGYRGLVAQFKEALPKKDELGYATLNRHKLNEIEGLIASLDRLLSSDMRSGIVLCQTVTRIQNCLKRMANKEDSWVKQKDSTGNHFVIKARMLPAYCGTGSNEDITLILYNGPRFRRKDTSKTGAVQEADDSGQFSQDLVEALDVTSKKVLLWSAYGSAARGINFVTTQNGMERDFQLFCLLNDPYYTRHTRPGSRGFSMEMFQSFAQVVRDENEEWAVMSRGDLLFQYSRNRWKRLRKEHLIDITRTVFQALGRGERRPHEEMPQQLVFLSSEAARTVHLGLRYAEELKRRASPAQRAVLVEIEKRNIETAIFESPEKRKAHASTSKKLAGSLRQYTSEMPKRFRSDAKARSSWTVLFNTLMFKDPVKYLAKLEVAEIPADFRDACYLQVPVTAELYTREIHIAGTAETIITDSIDGADTYDWIGWLAPEGLVAHLSAATRALLRGWNGFTVDAAEGKRKMFPQPWFVTEIMKGYIAELEFEEYVRAQFGLSTQELSLGGRELQYLDVASHPLHGELYQRFDYYLEVGSDTVVAIDMKNWTRSTDRLKKAELQAQAKVKHAQLCELLPDKTVHAVYVNLHGAHKFSVQHPPSGSIRFMSLFVSNPVGSKTWIANENLASVLLGK